ncbi:hypothetical protein [Antarctobacter jejuensis]|uniref:hypothetical protein n=1 Tax=Antarctobacter jejuensis TaxID=1439938 RepID=UPI003FCF441B
MHHLMSAMSLFALGALLGMGSPAEAAEITLSDDPAYGCIADLRGRIEEGDLARLRAVVDQVARLPQYRDLIYVGEDFEDGTPNMGFYTPLNLCLDSPGGSLTEAMDLTEFVHGRLGTVVRAGARCESACALIFMAGSFSTESDIGLTVNRFLHVDGKLGFHAPSLTVPEGRYDAASVAKAYQISVAVTELIFRNLVAYRFAPSLAARMHATPAEDMHYITKVQEAARWRISILGIDSPGPVTDAVVRNGCTNLYLSALDQDTSDPDAWPRLGAPLEEVRRNEYGAYEYTAFGMEAAGTCGVTAGDLGSDFTPDFWGEGALIRQSVWGVGDVENAVPAVFFGYLQNYMAWPGELPLTALPRNGRVQELTSGGRCYVFTGAEPARMTDSEACSRSRRTAPGGLMIDTHLWPSGARTTVEDAGLVLSLNGNRATSWYWPGDLLPDPSARPRCFRNDASNNVFCFVPAS